MPLCFRNTGEVPTGMHVGNINRAMEYYFSILRPNDACENAGPEKESIKKSIHPQRKDRNGRKTFFDKFRVNSVSKEQIVLGG